MRRRDLGVTRKQVTHSEHDSSLSPQVWLRGEPLELGDEVPHPSRTARRFAMSGVERAHLGRISRLAPNEIDAEYAAGLPRGNWTGPGAPIIGAVFHSDKLRPSHHCFVVDPRACG